MGSIATRGPGARKMQVQGHQVPVTIRPMECQPSRGGQPRFDGHSSFRMDPSGLDNL